MIPALVGHAYLVRGRRTVVVDTGMPGHGAKILKRLDALGVPPRDVALILLTHGHRDHFGSAAELKRQTGAPVAIHAADAWALRAGRNPPLRPGCASGRLLQPLFQNGRAEPCEPDVMLDEATDLAPFGIEGRIVSTPGHTPGSVSLLLDAGELIAGDLLVGGVLGGHVTAGLPGLPYFFDVREQLLASVRKILELPGLHTVYVGHGGPLAPGAIRNFLDACQPC